MDYSQASSSFNVIPRQEYAVGCHFLSRGIFLMQGLNPGLLHCEQIIYPRASPQALYMYLYKYICVCLYKMYIGNTLSPPFWWILHLQIQPTASRILCLWAAVHWIPRCRNLEKPRTEWGIWATDIGVYVLEPVPWRYWGKTALGTSAFRLLLFTPAFFLVGL